VEEVESIRTRNFHG